MPDTDLLFKVIAQDEYAANMQRAREMVDNMTEAEKRSIAVASQHQSVEASLSGAMDASTEAKRRATDQLAQLDRQYQSGEISATEYAGGVDDIKEKLEDASDSGLNWSSVMTGINQGMELARKVGDGLGKVYDFLIGDTVKYAGEVKDLALNLGLSTEETSKLLGVAQKFGVSNETLTNSLEMMVKRGMAPSLDGLAKLSDRMMAIQNPVERAHQLSELFGRGWTNLMPILEKGSSGIRAAADEAEKFGKVLSQETTDAVENLEIQANTLTERIDGLKTKIASGLIPVLNSAAGALDDIAFGQEKLNDLMAAHERQVANTASTYRDYEVEIARSGQLTQDLIEVTSRDRDVAGNIIGTYVTLDDRLYRVNSNLRILTEAQFENARATQQEAGRYDEGTRFARLYDDEKQRGIRLSHEASQATEDYGIRLIQTNQYVQEATDLQALLSTQQADVADRAIVYAEQDQKMSELKQKLADIDAQIIAQGPAYSAVESNKQMTAEQRAVAEANLAKAVEDVSQAQRKNGETSAEYNARLAEAKNKVSELSGALGSHSVVLGGATKAQLADKAAIEEQITAMELQNNRARAMEGVKSLGDALKDHRLTTEEYTERMTALNRVTGLYSSADLVAATNQQIFIDKLTNPAATDWYTVLLNSNDLLNTQYIPTVKTTTDVQQTHAEKMQALFDAYGDNATAVDSLKLKQDSASSALTSKVNPAHDLHIGKLQDEEGEFNRAEGFVQRYIDTLLAIPPVVNTEVRTTYTTSGTPPSSASEGGDNYGGQHATGVHMIIPPNYNDTYPLGFGKSGEEFYVGPPDQRSSAAPGKSVYHQETINIWDSSVTRQIQEQRRLESIQSVLEGM